MKTVLVVDDVPEVTTLLQSRLERTGRYTVVAVNNGWEALRMAQSEQPDFVVCDVNMPGNIEAYYVDSRNDWRSVF